MGLETAVILGIAATTIAAGGVGVSAASAAGAFDKKQKGADLSGLEEAKKRRTRAATGRAGTILTGGALSQAAQPTASTALLGGGT